MWRCYDSSYEDVDEEPGLAHQHHVVHGPSQPSYDYDVDGIGMLSSRQSIYGVGQHYNHVCFPVSYVMVNDVGQEQEPFHSMYPQTMTNHIPPPIPELPSLQSLMLSPSSIPHSYLMYQPSIMQHAQQLPSPSPPPLPPQPPPTIPQTIDGNTTQQQHEQCINGCDNSGTTSTDNTRITSDSLPYLRQLLSEERTVATGMTSSVIIHDSILSRQQLSNNDEIAKTPPSTSKKMKPTSDIIKQNTMTVDDNKVVTVCKQTILSALNKIIANNYESALYKLRKIIRVLDILMFNEGGRGIGSAKIETVRPWMETLKDIEERVSLKHVQQNKKNINQYPESSVFVKSERSHRRQVRQKSRFNSSSYNADSGNTTYHYYKNGSSSSSSSENYGRSLHQIRRNSKNRRYRTTGKLIMEQH